MSIARRDDRPGAHAQVPPSPDELPACFGGIDVYLFDQLLKGRLGRGDRVLDAGCGGGRNLHYLLRAGVDVHAVDASPDAVAEVRELASTLAPDLEPGRFVVAPVERMPFDDGMFHFVIASAVLHFARDEAHFDAMVAELWRVLAGGGLLFTRLAASTGIEGRVRRLEGRRFRLPDGTDRFLVDDDMLRRVTSALDGQLIEPIKTTNVEHRRCMTTWVLRKRGPGERTRG